MRRRGGRVFIITGANDFTLKRWAIPTDLLSAKSDGNADGPSKSKKLKNVCSAQASLKSSSAAAPASLPAQQHNSSATHPSALQTRQGDALEAIDEQCDA